ncbi:hypothetical protein FGO68_gene17771 [Halteria grandinella]|uniref:Uncharacterized protein n=1 Tax=Halteria grandinella TaxID=5974 RepID=A0A8J8NEQ9_HALGN|nr:hypothetical protein FGO68_gene17771 [Halteria grandinella]
MINESREHWTLEHGSKLHFPTTEDDTETDRKEMLAFKLQFNSSNYKIKSPLVETDQSDREDQEILQQAFITPKENAFDGFEYIDDPKQLESSSSGVYIESESGLSDLEDQEETSRQSEPPRQGIVSKGGAGAIEQKQ